MELLKRKIDKFLIDWKNNEDRKPLIVKGARQIGKTGNRWNACNCKHFCKAK